MKSGLRLFIFILSAYLISAPLLQGQQDAEAWNFINKANVLINLERYSEALEASDEAIKLAPNIAMGWNNKGAALDNLERYSEALEASEEAIRLDPNLAMAWYNKGVALTGLGRYTEALEAIDKSIKLDPNYAYAWRTRAIALGNLGKYSDALDSANEAARINPNDAGAWCTKANALGYMGRYSEALEASDEAIRINPNIAMAWNNKAAALDNLERYSEALEASNEAIKLDPNLANAWSNKAAAFNGLAKHLEALEASEESIRLDPNLAMAWNNKANALISIGKHSEGLEASDEAIRLDPNFPMAWNNKAGALYYLKRYLEGLEAIDEAIRLDPNFAMAWSNKAEFLGLLGRYSESLEASEESIRLDPNFVYAWINKAAGLVGLGRYSEALESSDEAIRIDSNTAEAWINRADALFGQKAYSDAIEASDESIRLVLTNSRYTENEKLSEELLGIAWSIRASALGGQGDYLEAIKACDEAIILGPSLSDQDLARVWSNRAAALIGLGNYSEALEASNEAIKLDPNLATAWGNRGGALIGLGNYSDALEASDEAIRIDPDIAMGWGNRASALLDQGNYLEALNESVRLDPSTAAAWENNGRVRLAFGQFVIAESSLTKEKEIGVIVLGMPDNNSILNDETVKILELDGSAFPKVKMILLVDRGCAMIGSLEKDNLIIKENNTVVSVDDFSFSGNASDHKLDLAIVFDETTSMDNELADLKLKSKDLVQKIKSSNFDARYLMVTFNGTEVATRVNWTNDADSFRMAMGKLSVSSGNINLPENSLDAIERALSLGFRSDAQKLMLVVTDEPSLQKGDGRSDSIYSMEDVKSDLLNSGITLIAASPDFNDPDINPDVPRSDLPKYAELRNLANQSNGIWIDINSKNFSSILEQIQGILTGTYVIEYTSPDKASYGKRTVLVSVDAPGCVEGGDLNSYVPSEGIANPNSAPFIDSLISDKLSPQELGSIITWKAQARDPDGDTVLFRFFLDDETVTDWTTENSWTWIPNQAGSHRIEVRARDGKHAGISGLDHRLAEHFIINDLTATNATNG